MAVLEDRARSMASGTVASGLPRIKGLEFKVVNFSVGP